jgi:RNA polymerase sigma-70 factor, ECF subfamily
MSDAKREQNAMVSAASQGDDEALALLVREYHDRVYHFGIRVCRDRFDTDDSMQEAFTKLAKRPEVQHSETVLGWLMRVVQNTCKRMMRPFMRDRTLRGARTEEASEVPSSQPDPEQALERFELIRAVHVGIAGLALPYREVLIMRDLEGLSGEETCEALGLAPATMKTRLHRARSQLRANLLQTEVVVSTNADTGFVPRASTKERTMKKVN